MAGLLVLSTLAHGGVGQLSLNGHELPTFAAYPLAGLLPLMVYVPLGGLTLWLSRPLRIGLRNALSVALLAAIILGLILRFRS